jgi:hypothetical protein
MALGMFVTLLFGTVIGHCGRGADRRRGAADGRDSGGTRPASLALVIADGVDIRERAFVLDRHVPGL